MMAAHKAELNFEGWRLSVLPQGDHYVWWVISPAPSHKIIKHDAADTFELAVYVAYRTLQGLTGKALPKPDIIETP